MTGALSRSQEQAVIAENERLVNSKAKDNGKKKAQKLSVSSWLGAGVGGLAVGYLTTKNPMLAGLFGGKLHVEHIIAAAGAYAEFKGKGVMAAAVSGAGQGALYSILSRRGAIAAVGG